MADEETKGEKVGETKTEEIKEEEKVEEAPQEAVKDEQPEKVEDEVEAPKPEEKVEEKKVQEKPAPTGKFKDLIREIEGLTTLELAELVKSLEERFGVSAAAPVAIAGAPTAGGAGTAPEVEEKTNFTVVLADSGAQKIAVIKALREINQELGLKEAKDIADAPPKEILKDAPKEKAEEAKKKLETAGAKVELK